MPAYSWSLIIIIGCTGIARTAKHKYPELTAHKGVSSAIGVDHVVDLADRKREHLAICEKQHIGQINITAGYASNDQR